jgi:hypothetical protein
VGAKSAERGEQERDATMNREIVSVGWDGRSNPMYRYRDELALPDHMRARPLLSEVLAQHPDATWINARFERVSLASIAGSP